jgi:hypothetical protein
MLYNRLCSEEEAEMPGPSDEMAPGAEGRSRLRASDADRDQVIDVLKAAFVQGRLAKDEFAVRVGQVLAARTYADLDSHAAGIPAGLTSHEPSAGASNRRQAPQLILIARLIWLRRRLIFLIAGLLLLVGGMALPSIVAFISGLLVVGSFAPQALPGNPESATVHTWQRLDRHQAGHPL